MRPNHYDYLKILALITMIVDHIGFWFYPDVELFRIIWRTAFPIFLFLVWYNSSFRFRWDLWFRGILLQIFLWMWAWQWVIDFWYANILIGIWVIRILLRWLQSVDNMYLEWLLFVLALVYAPMTQSFFDYGTLLIVFWMLWYWVKKRWWSWYSALMICVWVIYHVLFMWDLYWFLWYWKIILWAIWVFLMLNFLLLSKSNHSLVLQNNRINEIVLWLSNHSLQLYVAQAAIIWTLMVFSS